MRILQLVKNTGTQLPNFGMHSEVSTRSAALSIADLVDMPTTGMNQTRLSETWEAFAKYQEHVRAVPKISTKFVSLVQRWKAETMNLSSLNEIVLHKDYQRIIGLGPDVIPFILQELADNGGLWFWALKCLTGEDPVPEEDLGRTKKMAAAWLAWGAEKGYV